MLANLRPDKGDLSAILVGFVIAAAIALLPLPSDISPRYYSAVSAVIPLLLIAVLARLGQMRNRNGRDPGIEGYQSSWKSVHTEITDERARLGELDERLSRLRQETSAADLTLELEEPRKTLASARRENARLLERLEALPRSAGDLVVAHISLVALLTFLAGVGETAALSQLASAGHSRFAYFLANGSMAYLFLGLMYFELLPLIVLRERERATAEESSPE